MNNKITLLGQRDLHTDDELKQNIEYAIMLTGELISKEWVYAEKYWKFKLKIDKIDSIYNLKENKPIEFEKGKTPSQKLRWRITNNLGEDEYSNMINYIISRTDELCENYRENNKIN